MAGLTITQVHKATGNTFYCDESVSRRKDVKAGDIVVRWAEQGRPVCIFFAMNNVGARAQIPATYVAKHLGDTRRRVDPSAVEMFTKSIESVMIQSSDDGAPTITEIYFRKKPKQRVAFEAHENADNALYGIF